MIAGELGQTTSGKLVRDTYGAPDDMFGGALFDWPPERDGKLVERAWSVPGAPLLPNILPMPVAK